MGSNFRFYLAFSPEVCARESLQAAESAGRARAFVDLVSRERERREHDPAGFARDLGFWWRRTLEHREAAERWARAVIDHDLANIGAFDVRRYDSDTFFAGGEGVTPREAAAMVRVLARALFAAHVDGVLLSAALAEVRGGEKVRL